MEKGGIALIALLYQVNVYTKLIFPNKHLLDVLFFFCRSLDRLLTLCLLFLGFELFRNRIGTRIIHLLLFQNLPTPTPPYPPSFVGPTYEECKDAHT